MRDKMTGYRVTDIKQITHDTRQFTFPLPPGIGFDFLPGDHMKVYPDPGDPVEWRPYTPTTTPDIKDHFELVIKRYGDGMVPRYMHERKEGDEVIMSGPHEGGHYVRGMAREIGMVAGGTGITPFISMIRTIMREGSDTKVSLLFANKSVEDIILKNEFDRYAAECANFKRYYVIDKAPPGWDMGQGRITPELLREKLPAPSDQTVIFVCGPPMMQIEFRKHLLAFGHAKDKVIFP